MACESRCIRVAGDGGRQLQQIAEAVEHGAAVVFGDAGQEMPHGEAVVRTGGRQQSVERAGVTAFEAFDAAA